MRGATAIVLAVALAGCGTGGHDDAAPGPATTAAPTPRVAPAGAPYSFAAPAGFEGAAFPVGQLKAGSHPDFTSFLQATAPGDTTTVSVLAMHAGEQVPGVAADLGPRVWRELAPNAAAEPPVTPLALGSADGFEMVADTATAEATGRAVYRGAAIGQWVVVLICTAVGPAGDAVAGTCDSVARTVRLEDAAAPPVADAPATEDGSPHSFDVPEGFAAADPVVIREQLGGVPASLVVRSWENRVMVFSSDSGHRVAQIDTPSFCRVVAKILPHSTPQPDTGRTIDGRPAARCDATAFTDPAGHPIPDLRVAAYGVVHDTYLSVVLCYSTDAQRPEATKGCDAVLGTLKFPAPAASGA